MAAWRSEEKLAFVLSILMAARGQLPTFTLSTKPPAE